MDYDDYSYADYSYDEQSYGHDDHYDDISYHDYGGDDNNDNYGWYDDTDYSVNIQHQDQDNEDINLFTSQDNELIKNHVNGIHTILMMM